MRKTLVFNFSFSLLLFLLLNGCVTTHSHTLHRRKQMQKLKVHTPLHGTDILARCQGSLEKAETLKTKILASKPSEPFLSVLNLYNDILIELDASMSQAGLFGQVHPDEKTRKDADICEQKIAQFVTDLSLNKELYQLLKRGEQETLTADTKRMLDHTLRDFRRAGVDKDDITREKIKALKAELVTIGQEFSQNIRDDRFVIQIDKEDLEGLPKDYIATHQPNSEGKIEISTDYPDYIPFMQYAKSNKWRKELRFKFLNRGKKNGPVLNSLIVKRNELSRLLGYKSYADYVAEDKMIKNAKSIHEFVDTITAMAKDGADLEYKTLLEFKKKSDKNAVAINDYENAYLENLFKKEQFEFDAQEIRPYFAYDKVREGLLKVTSELYGLRYQPVPDASVWHPSVVAYDVYDESGKLGRIYLDMHPRENKFKHAALFSVVSGLKDKQYPEGTLVCNFPDPKMGPALMDHREVVTMFHEFGHLLHHLFAGREKWIPFSGVATEWDFVEAPSQFFEEWAWSPSVLQLFARHHETGEVISDELVKKMRAADEFGKALAARQQMFYAKLSVDYFDQDPSSFDPIGLVKTLQPRYSYYPYEEGTHFPYSFGHLDGYSAVYYTYMWSLSLAKDLFGPFEKNGLMNGDLAKRFKEKVLTPGGSKDAHELMTDFLGRPFKFEAFKQWLTKDPLKAVAKSNHP